MNNLSQVAPSRTINLPSQAHIASQCAAILARLDSEGLGLRDTDDYSYTPPVRGQCPSLDGDALTPDELTSEDVAATMLEMFPPKSGLQALLDAAGEDDGFDDFAPVGRLSETEWQEARIAAAITPPWPVRPAHAHLLPEWQELRRVEALGQLSGEQSDALHKLGYTLAGVEYWLALPRLEVFRGQGSRRREIGAVIVVIPGASRGPSPKQRPWEDWRGEKRDAVRYLWCGTRPHSRGKTSADELRRSFVVDEMNRRARKKRAALSFSRCVEDEREEAKGGSAATDRATVNDPQGRTPALGSSGSGAAKGKRSAPVASVSNAFSLSSSTHLENDDADESEPNPEVTVSLPSSLVARRAELGDHALYVCSLLWRRYRAKDTDGNGRLAAAEEGWRPLSSTALQKSLGRARVDGKAVYRSSIVMGSRERPGLLEQAGIIERRPGYCEGHAQSYRLTQRDHSAPCETVTLSLRAKVRPEVGPEVPGHLLASYARLELDYYSTLDAFADRVGVPRSVSYQEISVSIEQLPAPAVVYTKGGKEAHRQHVDPRGDWQHDLAEIVKWALPDAAQREHIYRSESTTRLESCFARLPSWTRAHMRLAGEPIVSLDIRAAALTFGAARLRASGADADPDVAGWCTMVETCDPYGVLHVLVHGREMLPEERDAWKVVVFKTLVYGSAAAIRKSDVGQAVAREWPGYFANLTAEKEAGKKTATTKDGYACASLQHEASIVLDALSPVFEAAGVPVATIHDAIYVRASDAERAATLFREVLAAAGVRAVVR